MRHWFLILLLSLLSSVSGAYDRFSRLQDTFKALGIADEPSYYLNINHLERAQTRQGFETLLKYIDPGQTLARYARWDDQKVIVFQDRDTRRVVDFSIEFKHAGPPLDTHGFIGALRTAAKNANDSRPLLGLRIALDPGHIGGSIWSRKEGKFVKPQGKKPLTEGVLTLQTAMLLGEQLEALGASVLLTRLDTEPVTDLEAETFDLRAFAEQELRASTDSAWFAEVLASNFPQNHPRVIGILQAPRKRYYYFFNRADLAARVDRINGFKPHLTLALHFDAYKTDELQQSRNSILSYVAGNVLTNEFASREQRFTTLRSLLDAHRWVESRELSGYIVESLSQSIHVPLRKTATDHGAIKVEDGIYARNLALTRLVSEGALAYVEILNYDAQSEFAALSMQDRSAEAYGIKFSYPSRLDAIVSGLKQGILNYVRSMEKRSLELVQ